MNKTLLGYIRLTRPANLVTAVADIWAGFSIAGLFFAFSAVTFNQDIIISALALITASICLYAGGVVLNDVFDYKLDKVERPERPIPSGIVPLKKASLLGGILLFLGCIFSFLVSIHTGIIAVMLSVFILTYDSFSKHSVWLGPLNMGICRGLNLMLGASILGINEHFFFLMLIPIVYIAAITLISQGEVNGNNKKMILIAGAMYSLVFIFLISLYQWYSFKLLFALPFMGLLGYSIFPTLLHAYKNNEPQNIKKAVKSGVISLIILNASIASGFSYWWIGILLVALLPVSLFLAKKFAVT